MRRGRKTSTSLRVVGGSGSSGRCAQVVASTAGCLFPGDSVPDDNEPHIRSGCAAMDLRQIGQALTGILVSPSGPNARRTRWHGYSNAPHDDVEDRRFRVTHPYHPLFQQEFEVVSYRQSWGEDRVWFQDSKGQVHSLPTSWTDAGAIDPFVKVAAGRSLFRVTDLLELTNRIGACTTELAGDSVKGKMS